MVVGMTSVFVPQDLAFMQVVPRDLAIVNPRLIPLIAHDRAGFGGGICSCGVLVCLCWPGAHSHRGACGKRSVWQVQQASGQPSACTLSSATSDFVHLVTDDRACVMYVTGLAIAILGHCSRAVEGTAVTRELPKIYGISQAAGGTLCPTARTTW